MQRREQSWGSCGRTTSHSPDELRATEDVAPAVDVLTGAHRRLAESK
jgi:hypothetical protein